MEKETVERGVIGFVAGWLVALIAGFPHEVKMLAGVIGVALNVRASNNRSEMPV